MTAARGIGRTILGITLCAVGTLVPWPIVSFPASLFLLLWFPGSLAARLLGFQRSLHHGFFVLMAISLSMTLTPVALDAIWRWTHNPLWMLAIWWILNVVLAVWAVRKECMPARKLDAPTGVIAGNHDKPVLFFEHSRSRVLFSCVALWIGGCIVLAHWPSWWNGAPIPASPRDYIKHHAVLASLENHELPLTSIYYSDPRQGPYYYYHYFYLLPATARLLGGHEVGSALAFSFFSAFLFILILGWVYGLTKKVTGGEAGATFAVFVLALVGGFDAVPVASRWIQQGIGTVQLDAWIEPSWRVHNYFTLMLWGPQHGLPLLTLLLAVGLLRNVSLGKSWIILGPLMAASVFGASVYFAIAMFPAVVIWCLLQWFWLHDAIKRLRFAGAVAAMGGISAVLMGPQAGGYLEMTSRHGQTLTTVWEHHPLALLGKWLPAGPAANLVDFPILFVIEHGLRALACAWVPVVIWRACRRDPGLLLTIIVSAIGVVLFLTFRSSVHGYDYGFKVGLLPLMALTAVLCGTLVAPSYQSSAWWNLAGWIFADRVRGWVRFLVVSAIVLGLPVGLYEAPAMAIRRFITANPHSSDAAAVAFVNTKLPDDAVVQPDPDERMGLLQCLDRRAGVMNPDNAEVNVFRPRNEKEFKDAYDQVLRAAMSESPQEAAKLFGDLGITHLFVGSVEQQRWSHIEKFNHRDYFDLVFDHPRQNVYAIWHIPADDPLNP